MRNGTGWRSVALPGAAQLGSSLTVNHQQNVPPQVDSQYYVFYRVAPTDRAG